ncbi:MAG: DUF971 domain-containing protein [Chloroflexi bacterium]|nr:DUF971 domain-containing protein [Chloroflexota bacterium]
MPKPQKILVDVDNQAVQINWQDGHISIYDLTYLRRACPCAECQPWKEGVGEVGVSPASVLQAVGGLNAVSDVTPVGGYAIQFHWKDGHAYGIYDWEYLRAVCPCDECLAKKK